jgi:hypothetical protein
MIVPVAHAGHWLVTVSYFIPVVGFLVWLAYITIRDRRRGGRAGSHERERRDSNPRPPA